MVITLTVNERLAEDLVTLLKFAVSSEIYLEKIGGREVILAIRTQTELEFDAVKQVLKKSGINTFNVDNEAA